MKNILLLSDTHGHLDDRILKYAEDADEVWHAGDIGTTAVSDRLKQTGILRAVYGNIDGADLRKEFPLHQRFLCEEAEIWMTHIGGYPSRYSPEVREEIRANPPALFISGHSHILKVMHDRKLNLLHMNPGAAGLQGFHRVRTMLRFRVEGKEFKDLEAIELKNRN